MQKQNGHVGCGVLFYPASCAEVADENRVPMAGVIVAMFEGNVANIHTFGDGRTETWGMQSSVQMCEGQENTPYRWRLVPVNPTLMVRAGCLLASAIAEPPLASEPPETPGPAATAPGDDDSDPSATTPVAESDEPDGKPTETTEPNEPAGAPTGG